MKQQTESIILWPAPGTRESSPFKRLWYPETAPGFCLWVISTNS